MTMMPSFSCSPREMYELVKELLRVPPENFPAEMKRMEGRYADPVEARYKMVRLGMAVALLYQHFAELQPHTWQRPDGLWETSEAAASAVATYFATLPEALTDRWDEELRAVHVAVVRALAAHTAAAWALDAQRVAVIEKRN